MRAISNYSCIVFYSKTRAYRDLHTHVYMHTNTYTRIRTCAHIYKQIHTHVQYIHTYVLTFVVICAGE